jgi:hypothetical protein
MKTMKTDKLIHCDSWVFTKENFNLPQGWIDNRGCWWSYPDNRLYPGFNSWIRKGWVYVHKKMIHTTKGISITSEEDADGFVIVKLDM